MIGSSVLADDPPAQPVPSSSAVVKYDTGVSPLLREMVQQRQQTGGQPTTPSDRQTHTLGVADGASAQVGSPLSRENVGSGGSSSRSTDDLVRFDTSGNVQVYIHMESTGEEHLAQLRALGAQLEVVNEDAGIVQAWVPTTSLDDIAALDSVREIMLPDYGVTKVGSVDTEGDAIHRTDLARTFAGLTGAGDKVGVISNGVSSWSSSRRKGDLPSAVEIDPAQPGSGNEGTALLEIVHDLAPGASLAFSGPAHRWKWCLPYSGWPTMPLTERALTSLSMTMGSTRNHISRTGRRPLPLSTQLLEGRSLCPQPEIGPGATMREIADGGSRYHDFDGSDGVDTALRIRIGFGVHVFLQWNDKFGASANDYDLFACPAGLKPTKFNLQNGQCKGGTRIQDGDENPSERVHASFSNVFEADIYVRKFEDGDEDKRLELLVTDEVILEHRVPEGGVVGHAVAAEVIAVGAIDASDPGHDTPQSFSDWGRLRYFFLSLKPGISRT